MLAIVKSTALYGLNGQVVQVEVDVSNGLPCFDLVGLPDLACRESRDRVRAAMKNSGFEFPVRRITVNLAPADLRKEGPLYDLPIAVGILAATGQLAQSVVDRYVFLGELSLNGQVRGVTGVLPNVLTVREQGLQAVVVPVDNAAEAALVKDVQVYPVRSLAELTRFLLDQEEISPYKVDPAVLMNQDGENGADMADVRGQAAARRALEVAAAGGHNLLMVGTPGSGKTMLARRLPGILPDLTFEEALEITKIYSLAGFLKPGEPLVTRRPFRSPHHSASAVGLVGGGRHPRPGEISLAHHGILFLDELPEFHRDVLEALRQPLEDGVVTISRVSGAVTYPASLMLVAAANPCPCGYLGDPTRECTCTPYQVQRYLGRISGPLLDRIDIHLEVSRVDYEDLARREPGESSAEIKKRVEKARTLQRQRFSSAEMTCNARMTPAQVRRYCSLSREARSLFSSVFRQLNLSARSHDRLLKVARTIADLDGSEIIESAHLAEAVQYRSLEARYWPG
ncbi:YifB family Mg chelatase-like AAA ATPase [Desulfofundulus sp.]|uniref:YifB family Mg chelatase-like AAA ATPase n=1 Tax=Desulfofundulus sp. TaxID=2282750 RepID=UPI003C771D75